MILPDIVSIHRLAEEQAVLSLRVQAGLPAFDGHFPGHPILPGVVQVDWALRLADQIFGLGQQVARDFQVKFRRIIVPESPVTLFLRVDCARHRLEVEYRVGDEVASTGRIHLERHP
jgi:3-hydroxymyristoyl/3-hydroxydecanoyl-(acyl carrier protein) dehydratase